jgi:hypothetical protein
MAKYLTNKETQATLENIIMNAENKLVLVSPYIVLTGTLHSRIKAAAEKGVRIKIIYRTDKVNNAELDRLKSIKNIELKFRDDLHAKCYFNEKEMIITSLNLLKTSESNWEMGIHVSRSNDKEIFEGAMRDVQTIFMDSGSICKNPVKEKVKEIKPNTVKSKSDYGYCIRCGEDIRFNIKKPLCPDCFESWNEWGNEDYPENFCHFSGEESDGDTSYEHPVLKKNWKKANEVYDL